MKKLKRKVDKTVSGLNNGSEKPATFRTAQRSMQPGGYYGRSGYGYAGPPPWIGGLLGWAALFGAAWAVTKVFGLGGGAVSASPPSAAGASAAPGAGPGRWVKDRTLGGREIWVEDRYAKGARGNALAESSRPRPVSPEAADKARRKEEAKAAAGRRPRATPWNPRGGAHPRPGTARSLSTKLKATRASGAGGFGRKARRRSKLHRGGPRRFARRVRGGGRVRRGRGQTESARAGIFKAGVEFALEAAARGEVRRG